MDEEEQKVVRERSEGDHESAEKQSSWPQPRDNAARSSGQGQVHGNYMFVSI